MACVEKLPHKECGSSKGLQVYYNEKNENYTGYCHSCSTFIPDPYPGLEKGEKPKVKVKTEEEILLEVQEIRQLPVVSTKYRSIPAKFYASWGVRQSLSEFDGKTPFAIYYGYTKGKKLLGWKTRMLARKQFWSVGATKEADPYGWIQARKRGGKRVYITEGEQDAIALDYILQLYDSKGKFSKRRHAIISLPNGVDSVPRTLRLCKKAGWKDIVLVIDNDGPGKEAIKKAQKLLPDIMMVDMPLNCKDANDAAVAGPESMSVMAQNCLFNIHKPPIKGVIQVSDVIKKAMVPKVMGLSYPHPDLTEMAYGQRFAECVAVGAGVGLGKTLLAHEWSAHNMMVHNMASFMILLEEQNEDSLLNVAGKIDSIPYHVPNVPFDVDKKYATMEALEGKLFLWESDADQYLRFDMDEIINAIRFNVAEFGVKFVYIDNMTRLVDHLEPSEANTFINKYSSELEGLSVQLDIHIDVFSHLNNTGKINHEAGGSVRASQFTGSRGLMRSFPMMIGFERNKHAEEDASKSYINILKNRKYGNEGLIKTQYSPRTGRLLESEWEGKGFLESTGGYKHEKS